MIISWQKNCEITCMAADAGLIRTGEEVIAIAGSGRGADTAIVLKASNTHTFFDIRILELSVSLVNRFNVRRTVRS